MSEAKDEQVKITLIDTRGTNFPYEMFTFTDVCLSPVETFVTTQLSAASNTL
jgi:hypothetical protein